MYSDRVAVKKAAVAALNAAFAAQTSNPDLSAVRAFFGEPGELTTPEYVSLGQINGAADADVYSAAGSTDNYTIAAVIDVTGFATEEAACERAQLILNECVTALFSTKFAGSLGCAVYPGRLNGPNGVAADKTEPAAAVVEFDLACRGTNRGT